MATTRKRSADGPPLWTIGAVSRNTGLSPHTLRIWQRRYGFPKPERKPSGHRLYTERDVNRLRRIGQAIKVGHRAGQVVGLPESLLDKLLPPPGQTWDIAAYDPMGHLFDLVRSQRGEDLTAALLQEAAMTGPLNFLEKRAIPLTEKVGEAWASGDLGVRHEHTFSERLGDVLRTLRVPYERRGEGPLLLLTTLSGERHGLGLQMAALVVALAGGRPDVLGTDTPVDEIERSWRTRRHDAIGISISVFSAGPDAWRAVARLRRALPASVSLLVGGRGAAESAPGAGVTVVSDLAALYDWVRRAAARGKRTDA